MIFNAKIVTFIDTKNLNQIKLKTLSIFIEKEIFVRLTETKSLCQAFSQKE